MAIRDKLRRLQKMARGNLAAIEQRDGSIAYIDPKKSVWDVFGHFSHSLYADYERKPRPEPPACLQVVANAKDRRNALEQLMQGWSFLAVDAEMLIRTGQFVPRPMAPSHPPITREEAGGE